MLTAGGRPRVSTHGVWSARPSSLLEDGGISLGRRLAGDESPVRGDIILAEGGPGVVCGPGEMIRSRIDTGVAREPRPEEALYFRP